MNSLSKVTLIVIGLLGLLVGGFFLLNNYIYNEKQADEDTLVAASYFQESLEVLGIERVGHPIEGFDASFLMTAFPGIITHDFNGVEASEGHYEIKDGEIEFVPRDRQMTTSAAGAISSEGYTTLLENLSVRLNVSVRDEVDVDKVVEYISINEQTDQISVRFGEKGTSSLGVSITVLEIIQDSRCPNPVNCIQAGTVQVRVSLESGLGTADQIFELNQLITTEAEEVTLVSVDPWPDVDQSIEEDDYVFKFEIRKRNLD